MHYEPNAPFGHLDLGGQLEIDMSYARSRRTGVGRLSAGGSILIDSGSIL